MTTTDYPLKVLENLNWNFAAKFCGAYVDRTDYSAVLFGH